MQGAGSHCSDVSLAIWLSRTPRLRVFNDRLGSRVRLPGASPARQKYLREGRNRCGAANGELVPNPEVSRIYIGRLARRATRRVANRRYAEMYGPLPEHVKPATTLTAKQVVDKGIASGATKASGFFAKLGWKKLGAFCLKIAAASPLAAKIVVSIAIVTVAACIFRVVRSA